VAEYERALTEHGVTREEVKAFLASSSKFGTALHKAPHAYAGTAADLVAEIAPYMNKTRWERTKAKLDGTAKRSRAMAKSAPHMVVSFVKEAVVSAPAVAARVKEDVAIYREMRRAKRSTERTVEAAAE
jgi:hypothetical protein